MPAEDPLELAGQWARELDRHGVERAALIASIPGDEYSVAAAIGAHASRFFGYFMVNPLAPGAAATVEAALAAGLRGLCFFPAMHRYSMHDERAVALLEIAAARGGCLAFVHCGVLSVGVRAKVGLPSQFDMRFSNPLDLHALALRYPQLPFVVPHFGAGLFREALMLCDSVSERLPRYFEQQHMDEVSGAGVLPGLGLPARVGCRRTGTIVVRDGFFVLSAWVASGDLRRAGRGARWVGHR